MNFKVFNKKNITTSAALLLLLTNGALSSVLAPNGNNTGSIKQRIVTPREQEQRQINQGGSLVTRYNPIVYIQNVNNNVEKLKITGVSNSVSSRSKNVFLEHNINNHQEALDTIAQSYNTWPSGTVFVSLVGEPSDIMAFATADNYFFIVYDNGTIDYIDQLTRVIELRLLTNNNNCTQYRPDSVELISCKAASFASGQMIFSSFGEKFLLGNVRKYQN